MARTGATSFLTVLTLTLGLIIHCQAKPYQCNQLELAIPACSCEARILRNIEYNDQVIINCRNLNMTVIPTVVMPSDHIIYEMTLAMNNIQTVPAGAFNGLKIQRIDLRKNRLTSVDANAFRGLEVDLKELHLEADKGSTFQPPINSLINLTSLTSLTLENFKFPQNGISTGTLNLLSGLQTLYLAHNNLAFIQPLSLPQNLLSLTLDHQNSLASFPVDVLRSLKQLQSLKITNTLISALYVDALELNSQLTNLDLSYNQINQLFDGCFNGITNSLLTLSLGNNPIPAATTLNEIKQLTALQTLRLAEINLATLPPSSDFLLNKNQLLTLDLQGNNLVTLGPNTFSTLGKLKELYLGRNQLRGMDDQVFAGLSSLKLLDLSHQQIATGETLVIPPSLSSLNSLETLKLSKTPVDPTTLWSQVSQTTSIKVLQLDSTLLTTLPDNALNNLTQLTELNLDSNSLTTLTQAMMAGARNLKTLTLNKNQITTISNCAFYNYAMSPDLSLELMVNPLHCDCQLRWLLEKRDADDIQLTGQETCASPPAKAGSLLSSFVPGDLMCVPDETDAACEEVYSSTTPSPTPTIPIPTIKVTITNSSATSITVQWTSSNIPNLAYFTIQSLDLEISESSMSDKLYLVNGTHEVTGLKSGTTYSICVFAYDSSHNSLLVECLKKTTPYDNSDNSTNTGDDDSSQIGIIVGVVIGLLVLLAIIAAILYLVCLRRRHSKNLPEQPHVFTNSELPGMGANTRQFSRPPEKHPPRVGRALDENIKVTIISDGKTQPMGPGGRHSAGSYQFLDQKHPNPNPDIAPKSGFYTNDVDSRPLPNAPNPSLEGYYNGGLKQENSAHLYNQID